MIFHVKFSKQQECKSSIISNKISSIPTTLHIFNKSLPTYVLYIRAQTQQNVYIQIWTVWKEIQVFFRHEIRYRQKLKPSSQQHRKQWHAGKVIVIYLILTQRPLFPVAISSCFIQPYPQYFLNKNRQHHETEGWKEDSHTNMCD